MNSPHPIISYSGTHTPPPPSIIPPLLRITAIAYAGAATAAILFAIAVYLFTAPDPDDGYQIVFYVITAFLILLTIPSALFFTALLYFHKFANTHLIPTACRRAFILPFLFALAFWGGVILILYLASPVTFAPKPLIIALTVLSLLIPPVITAACVTTVRRT